MVPLVLILNLGTSIPVIEYWNQGGGQDDTYFGYFDFEKNGVPIADIMWELGADDYSKKVTFTEFAMKAYGEVRQDNDEMKRVVKVLDKKSKIEKAFQIAILSGTVWVLWKVITKI